MTIPLAITLNYCWHRQNLHKALDYIYHSDYTAANSVNKKKLEKTISSLKASKRNSFDIFSYKATPYLSTYYSWIVLDNLTLTNEKIEKLDYIFFGKKKKKESWRRQSTTPQPTKNINLTKYTANSHYDAEQDAYRSWVDLELTNNSNSRFGEYATTLTLPTGAWISDYYLYVGDRKDYGLLTEKRAAKWIYSSIRNINRDPGILYYLGGNKIRFKVFPFAKEEIRKTGFEIIHKEPFLLEIDGQSQQLGDLAIKATSNKENEAVIYVSSNEKEELQKTARTPYFHFIVDASTDQNLETHIDSIHQFYINNKLPQDNFKVTFANSDQLTLTKSNLGNWPTTIESMDRSGGFFIERAIKKTFFDAYKENTSTYPIIVILSDKSIDEVSTVDTRDWNFALPEGIDYYRLSNTSELLTSWSAVSDSMHYTHPLCLLENKLVLEYPMDDGSIRYLHNNKEGSIIFKRDTASLTDQMITEKSWTSGLLLQAKHISHTLHPELVNKEWTNIVRQSFRSRIMTPLTSYIVLETEGQKQVLLKKQQDMLSGHKALDADNQVQNMSEPSTWLICLLIILFLWYRKLKERKYNFSLTDRIW